MFSARTFDTMERLARRERQRAGDIRPADFPRMTGAEIESLQARALLGEMMIEADNTAALGGRYREAAFWRRVRSWCADELATRRDSDLQETRSGIALSISKTG